MGEQKPVVDLSGLAAGSLQVTPADSLGSATHGHGMTEVGAYCGYCGYCYCGRCYYTPDE